jgi:hypothetical protein
VSYQIPDPVKIEFSYMISLSWSAGRVVSQGTMVGTYSAEQWQTRAEIVQGVFADALEKAGLNTGQEITVLFLSVEPNLTAAEMVGAGR